MSNNIVSFNPVSTSKAASINTASASKNIINSTLLDSSLNYQKNNETVYEEDVNINLNKNLLEEYTLEELLAEGKETQAEIEAKRKEAEEKAKAEAEAKRQAKIEAKKQELEDLYQAREDNNGLFHPNKEAEIEEQILELEKMLDVDHKPDGWESFCDTAKDVGATAVTFAASTVEGVVDVGETIVDGAVQVGGGLVAYGVGLVDEEAGNAMKQGIQDFVSYDASGAMYDSFVDITGIDEDIAYGWAHTAGNVVGQVAGYAAISMIPGGAVVTAGAGALAAAGSTAETAYANGANFDEAFVASSVAGAFGAAGGAGMSKLGTMAKGATSLTQALGYTGAGMTVGAFEAGANTVVEYATYGNNNYDSYADYMDATGGWLNLAIGAGAGAISTGGDAVKGYREFNIQYRDDLVNMGYEFSDAKKICKDRRSAYSEWTKECKKYGGWAAENIDERFQAMDNASLALDANGTIGADEFWKLKGNKELRVENPTYSSKQMQNLENIRNSGEVNIYLTEDQYKSYKLGSYRDGVKFDGRVDSDGATRAYCTKLNSNQTSITSSKELGEILGTGWGDGQKIYKGTLTSSTVSFSSGLESSANPDWIPGGYTLSMKSPNNLGVPDLVVKDYLLDPNNYKPVN